MLFTSARLERKEAKDVSVIVHFKPVPSLRNLLQAERVKDSF